jgi:Protein tyrosine phosphatase-like protein, PTPLA
MSGKTLGSIWLAASNFITAAAWGRVALIVLTTTVFGNLSDSESNACSTTLVPAVKLALTISFIEIFNCIAGFTRSPLPAVLLFSCTRAGVEYLLQPLIPCGSWQHILTVSMWGVGDLIRFSCLGVVTLFPEAGVFKSIRFTVAPVLFPVGASGEMLMVILAGYVNKRPILYGAAALWPFFFYPMMQQLLKQRRKHFQPTEKKKQIKSV